MTDSLPAIREDSQKEPEQYRFSNKIGRIVFLAMEDVMGGAGTRAVLNQARLQDRIDNYPPNNFERGFTFEEMGRIQRALTELYGARGGSGLAHRIGRQCFRLGVQDLGGVLGVADLALRVLPMNLKLRLGFEVLAQMFNRFTDHVIRLGEDEEYYYWIMERCGTCWGRRCDEPCCDLAVGALEEAVYWVSGGGRFYVEEVSCIAAGAETCTILIGKQALD